MTPRPARDVYTVSRLNGEVRDLLEASFPMLWVEGEISNLSRPASGHLYFSLKDAASQVRCAMFRGQNRLLRFRPEHGQHVLARARVGFYPPRGDFQLIVESMEEFGEGALQQAFEALKRRLAAEGLFESTRKRAVPTLPRRIGVITSPTGAAIRDILTVLGRRFPAIPVLIYPVPVQGEGAAARIADAIRLAEQRRECDVLILARGGGSLEDLWAFNDEGVARAIADCTIPLVSGIGHEVDFTIADFAADHRAATPSAAAEAVTPDQAEWRQRLHKTASRIQGLARRGLQLERQRLAWLARRLEHPRRRLLELAQRIDGLSLRLTAAQGARVRAGIARLHLAVTRLNRESPAARLGVIRTQNEHLGQRLRGAWRNGIAIRRSQLTTLVRALDAVSPLATLHRGYAILTGHPDGRLVHSVGDTAEGQQLRARLTDGSLLCTVDERAEAPAERLAREQETPS